MRKPIYFFIISLSILTSCSSTYYVANTQNTPMFKEKGEVATNLSLGYGELSAGFDLQAALSITNHFAFQTNVNMWSAVDNSSGIVADFAPGFFTGIGEKMVFEVYGGYGKGHVFPSVFEISNYNLSFEFEKITFDKYFVQPAFGFTSNNIDFIFSSRFCLIDYYGRIPIYALPSTNQEGFNLVELNQFYTIDPALTLRLGWRHFKFKFQAMYIFALDAEQRQLYDYQNFSPFYDRINVNVGIHLNFGGHYSKQNPDI